MVTDEVEMEPFWWTTTNVAYPFYCGAVLNVRHVSHCLLANKGNHLVHQTSHCVPLNISISNTQAVNSRSLQFNRKIKMFYDNMF